ncbi:MAG: diaminopimelate epimerase [Rhodothermales bacterium]
MPRLVVEFTKMNGAGNDFVVIDNRFFHFSDAELSAMAPRLCRRRFGIGADGILAYNPPENPDHHFRMRYVNADGSIGTMCGNGARCLSRFARRAGLNETNMVFETDAGVLRAHVPERDDAPVRIYLSPPRSFTAEKDLESAEAREAGPVHYIWTGTEHAVCFVGDVDKVPVERWGPAIRRDPALLPAGANVDFVQASADGSAVLRARTYEKGVEGETLACGTGAVASAIAARLTGRVAGDRIDVEMPGGTLTVGFQVKGIEVTDVYLEGPAEVVYRGTVEI